MSVGLEDGSSDFVGNIEIDGESDGLPKKIEMREGIETKSVIHEYNR